MSNNTLITNTGKLIVLDAAYSVTPTYTAISQAKIGENGATPTTTSTDLANPVSGSSGVFIPLRATYPQIVASASNEVEYYIDVVSTDFNGFTIDSSGVFNSDSTPAMHTIDLFNAQEKYDTDELEIKWVDRLI